MADTRQRYHGWIPRKYGPRAKYTIPRSNLFYWRMEGRAWFYYLRKASVSKNVKLVFDCPMSKPLSRS